MSTTPGWAGGKIDGIMDLTMGKTFTDRHQVVTSFEIFGYDFMLDEDLKPWLIEVNTNTCLELTSHYLARLIHSMLENAIK